MKKFFVVLIMVLAGLSAKGQAQLSYDGYYHTVDSLSPYRYYLRFYPDGSVIGVNTAGKPENLLPWFKKENKTPYKGTYTLSEGKISFKMISEGGEVHYEGNLVKDNRLILVVTSMINKFTGNEEYFFLKIANLK